MNITKEQKHKHHWVRNGYPGSYRFHCECGATSPNGEDLIPSKDATDTAHREFFRKYAIGEKWPPPSCLVCGQTVVDAAISHAELAGIVVCFPCRDARAERDRLRAALEKIANGDPNEVRTPLGPMHAAGIVMQWEIDAKIAREALHPEPTGDGSYWHECEHLTAKVRKDYRCYLCAPLSMKDTDE